MDTQTFNDVFDGQIAMCQNILVDKAKEYATSDRLHNFKVAAILESCTHTQALAGMMVKHTVSVYDMCKDGEYPMAVWEEKITDHINYLILLKAILFEEQNPKLLQNGN